MNKKHFDRMVKSLRQMDDITQGERAASRQFAVNPMAVREIRQSAGLSQERFARMIDVQVGTLRNWEQGRREPTGPAKALLRAIQRDPEHVLRALAGETA